MLEVSEPYSAIGGIANVDFVGPAATKRCAARSRSGHKNIANSAQRGVHRVTRGFRASAALGHQDQRCRLGLKAIAAGFVCLFYPRTDSSPWAPMTRPSGSGT